MKWKREIGEADEKKVRERGELNREGSWIRRVAERGGELEGEGS